MPLLVGTVLRRNVSVTDRLLSFITDKGVCSSSPQYGGSYVGIRQQTKIRIWFLWGINHYIWYLTDECSFLHYRMSSPKYSKALSMESKQALPPSPDPLTLLGRCTLQQVHQSLLISETALCQGNHIYSCVCPAFLIMARLCSHLP